MSGVAALVLAGWAGALSARRIRRVRPALQTLAPAYRTPLFYLLDGRYDGRPPRRGTMLERVVARALPAGIGRAVTLPGRAGAPRVPGVLYDPPGRQRPSGALLWIHGGGLITGGPWMDHGTCNRFARELGLVVLSVDYRLAPENPFPAGAEDCYAALAWLHEQAAHLGLDPARIGVAGASAGGGLAAVVAQLAHDRGLPLAFQGLVYPMLDDRTVLRDTGSRGAVLWTPARNRDAWGWYLGHPVREEEGRPYAAASRRPDLSGLAPAWIGVGDADLFHDEDVEYARRLGAAGVPVELVVVPGMPHAADMAGIPATRPFTASLTTAIGEALARG